MHDAPTTEDTSNLSVAGRIVAGIKHRWFLIALGCILVIGGAFGPQLKWLSDFTPFRHVVIFAVLFVMALPLAASAMLQAIKRPQAPGLAILLNIGLLPLLTWGVLAVIGWNRIRFGLGDDMSAGVLVAIAAPCTLASASVWTRRAGGNDAVAILVTIITNAFCFLTTPLWLKYTIGQEAAISLPEMIMKLLLLVVLPMSLAQMFRIKPEIAAWATKKKPALGLFAQIGVLTIVLLGAISIGVRLHNPDSPKLQISEVVVMVLLVAALHTVMLLFGLLLAKWLRFEAADQSAIAIAGSQKTCMVGFQVGLELGITILPMVCYHVAQLLIDTVFADRRKSAVSDGNLSAQSSEKPHR